MEPEQVQGTGTALGHGSALLATSGPYRATLALAGLCTLATAATLVPGAGIALGDHASDAVIRLLTAPFVHGLTDAWAIPHLIGNLLLLLYAGSRVEAVLGTARFSLLTGAALTAYAMIQLAWNYEVNGASVFIWAYGPPLAVLDTPFGSRCPRSIPRPTLVVLSVMWLAVPLLMTSVPYAYGWSGSFLGAFVVANAFHFGATAVGAGAAWIWWAQLRVPGDDAQRKSPPKTAGAI